jgi:hypothetical protein
VYGYPAIGFDPSEGLLAQARALYPDQTFVAGALPDLAGVAGRELRQRVHLPKDAIPRSVGRS